VCLCVHVCLQECLLLQLTIIAMTRFPSQDKLVTIVADQLSPHACTMVCVWACVLKVCVLACLRACVCVCVCVCMCVC